MLKAEILRMKQSQARFQMVCDGSGQIYLSTRFIYSLLMFGNGYSSTPDAIFIWC